MWNIYIPLGREPEPVDLPCESLGHFYEDYECIYCAAKFCTTEHGGHSFELWPIMYAPKKGDGASPRYCYHCRRNVVNITKG
jgi:hypothetical protein